MGYDIQLFAEGLLRSFPNKAKKWINIDSWFRQDGGEGLVQYLINENEGFDYINLIDNRRDYDLFYLLAGVTGKDERNSYPPIAKAKGLPKQMDSLIKVYNENHYNINFNDETDSCNHASYLTLKELNMSGYGNVMRLKGWVNGNEYLDAIESLKNCKKYQLRFVDVKCPPEEHEGLVLKEWDGYLNLNLTYMIEHMKILKKIRNIEDDEDIRIVFWFDN